MDSNLCDAISQACSRCHLSGGCCFEARPPLSQERIDILRDNGVPADYVEFAGYRRLRLRQLPRQRWRRLRPRRKKRRTRR